LEHIRELILTDNVCCLKDEWAWDLIYSIIFLKSIHNSPLFTIAADVAALQEQDFAFSRVVGCLPLIISANV
jgi:hypothetical protein